MKIHFRLSVMVLLAAAVVSVHAGPVCSEDDKGSMSINILPVRIADVEGDQEKFRAHTWMTDGYAGGINDLNIQRQFDNGTWMTLDLRAIPDENDQKVDLHIKQEDLGTMNFRYQMFKKYYDHTGGFYYPYSTAFESTDGEEDLDLNIGHIALDVSPDIGDVYGFTFSYEHRSKDGYKSRLSWAEVFENSIRREISPSWQSIDETTDIISVKGETGFAGFDVSGEQKYEITKTDSVRTEKWLSDTSGADTKIRRQFQEPESITLTTILNGEKWFNDDQSFLALAYRFHQINNKESETTVETDETGTPTNAYSSPKQFTESGAENKLDSHSWIGHYMTKYSPQLNFSAKSKVEMVTKDSSSAYNADTGGAAPDGVIDDQNLNDTKNTLYRFGESLGFRYTGLPRTAVYGDVEIGYIRNNLSEEENDESGTKTWFRDTDTDTQKIIWTLGSRVIPSKVFNITGHLRHNYELNDYDDQDETAGVNSAFFEELKIVTNEATTKMTWKPMKWLQNSLRYQFLHKKFDARVESLDGQHAVTRSHIVTIDTLLQPVADLLVNFSLSHQDSSTLTAAAADDSISRAPKFNADVTSLLFSTSYAPRQDLSIIGVVGYSFSDNFEDFTATALPLAVTNSHFNTEIGLRWAPKDKDWSFEPKYAYYEYDTHSEAENEGYRAHVGWMDFSYNW